MTKEDINKRFIIAVNSLTDSKKTIALKLNMKNSTFSEILKERMNVATNHIADFALNFNISEMWIITGEGEMLKTSTIGTPGPEQCKTCDILKQEINELKQDKKMLMGSLRDKDELISIIKDDLASLKGNSQVG